MKFGNGGVFKLSAKQSDWAGVPKKLELFAKGGAVKLNFSGRIPSRMEGVDAPPQKGGSGKKPKP